MSCLKLIYSEESSPLKVVHGVFETSGKAGAGLYRYGFNGMEKDDEIAGDGNSYTAEFWQYDSRLGRRWNVDPKPNPSISNYATFANNPILYNDILGDTIHRFRPDGTYMDAFDDGRSTVSGLIYTKTGTFKSGEKTYNRYSDGISFDFNDYDLDKSNLKETKITVVKDKDLKEDIKTVHKQKGSENLIVFMERESRPEGHESWFSGTSKGRMDPRTSFSSAKGKSGLFLVQDINGKNKVYNHDDFGNFLWGMAGSSFGLGKYTLKTAAHANNAFSGNDQNLDEVPLLDSDADQNAISDGVIKNQQFGDAK